MEKHNFWAVFFLGIAMSIEPANKGQEKKTNTFLAVMFFSQLPENNLANAWNRMSLLLLREKKAERIKTQLFSCQEVVLFQFACVLTHPVHLA